MKHYIFFGPPGAGKGTQSKLIAEHYNFCHISTGQMLRDEIELDSELGHEAKELISNGKFVKDESVLKMVRNYLLSTQGKFTTYIFDGFPRTLNQAAQFDVMLKEMGVDIDIALISLEIDDSLIIERIKKRSLIEDRADDMYDSVIESRVKTYHKKTAPLINYYKERGVYYPIDGSGSVESVFKAISKLIDQLDGK